MSDETDDEPTPEELSARRLAAWFDTVYCRLGVNTWDWDGTDNQAAEQVVKPIYFMVKAYTRGEGFNADGVPGEDLTWIIVNASKRLQANPSQLSYSESEGPASVFFRNAFEGFTTGELIVLNTYRKRAL